MILAAAGLGLVACGPSITTVARTGPVVVPHLTPEEMVAAINAVRKRNGRPPLTFDETLAEIAFAQARAAALHDTLSHDFGPHGTLRDRATAVGYEGPIGENLAGGQLTLEETLDGWLASPGHRRTLLSDMWTRVGMAVVPGRLASRFGIFWAADFGV